MSEDNVADTPANDESANGGNIEIVLEHGGIQLPIQVPLGTDLGHVRTLLAELDEIGAPSSYTLGVNGTGQDDQSVLQNGDLISFRPVSGNKG